MENIISIVLTVILACILIFIILRTVQAKRAIYANQSSDSAVKMYKFLARFNKNEPDVRYLYARALRNKGDAAAEQEYRAAIQVSNPRSDAFFELSVLLENKGDTSGARDILTTLQNTTQAQYLTPAEQELLRTKLAALAPQPQPSSTTQSVPSAATSSSL